MKWDDVIKKANGTNPPPPRRVNKSPDEWRALLTPEQYYITRERGTEPAHSSGMCSLFKPARYHCVCCNTLLFDSANKFDSSSGWPSFAEPAADNVISYRLDDSYGMRRIETNCNVCDAHLGHVFPDGPEPSGLRFCINAIALQMEEKGGSGAP